MNVTLANAILAELTAKQLNVLKTIKRHGGTRLMSALDGRTSKALARKGLLTCDGVEPGYYRLSDSATAILSVQSS